ncbi:MAG: precorrin-8X methylmutase [Thermodesulfobacteriota bacterium]
MRPDEIEKTSFEIIEEEAGRHGFAPDQWAVVARMIHTSADFEYLDTVRIHPEAVDAGIAALKKGVAVITDTNMVLAGLRKKDLAGFGCEAACFMASQKIVDMAEKNGTTRAEAAVDAAAEAMAGGIYVVGNAPTALMRLIALIRQGRAKPALVAGFPVGFVNAAESKAQLLTVDTPYITNTGRKGGSNVAAAVVNALVLLAKTR